MNWSDKRPLADLLLGLENTASYALAKHVVECDLCSCRKLLEGGVYSTMKDC